VAKVLRLGLFERGVGSDERVAQPPWTHDFGPGFRCDLGSPFLWILSFGEAKESISPAAKRFKVRELAINKSYNYRLTQSAV